MRLRAEYNSVEFGKANLGELSALLHFCEDYIGDFSAEVTDYLAQSDRPLAALYDLLPISLKSATTDYDEDKVQEAIEIVEHQIGELKNRVKDEPTAAVSNKRNLDGYVERNSFNLSGRLVILAEKAGAEEPYLVCEGRWDNPFGVEEYYHAVTTADYIEAVGEFLRREDGLLEFLEHERDHSGLPFQTLAAADCIPNGLDENLEGKLIVIKPEILAPEFRSAEHQLKICQGGFGANPNARGNAVFCKDLYSGKESRFERCDVAGVIDPDKIPEWAKQKLAVMETIKEPLFRYNEPPVKEQTNDKA
jgi:hypothetical protein